MATAVRVTEAAPLPVNLSSLILPASSNIVRASRPQWLKKVTVVETIPKGEESASEASVVVEKKPKKPRKVVKRIHKKKPSLKKKKTSRKPIKKTIKKTIKKKKR